MLLLSTVSNKNIYSVPIASPYYSKSRFFFLPKSLNIRKFVYSWTIGENGDVGVLDIEVEVSSQAYPPAEAHNSLEITESGGSSNTEDPFDSNSED